MNIMNSLVNDVSEWIASEASKLTSYNNVDLGLNCIKTHYNFYLLITLEVLKGCWKKTLDIFNKVQKSLENHWKHLYYFESNWDIFENSGHDKLKISGI